MGLPPALDLLLVTLLPLFVFDPLEPELLCSDLCFPSDEEELFLMATFIPLGEDFETKVVDLSLVCIFEYEELCDLADGDVGS